MKVCAAAAFCLATFFLNPTSAAFCPLLTEGLSGLNQEYSLTALGKIEVLDFDADYVYKILPSGSEPYVKILAASEQPAVFTTDEGVLTISPEECDVSPTETSVPSVTPGEESSATKSFLSSTLALSTMCLLPTGRATSFLTAVTLLASASWVHGAGHLASENCKPKLSIEIGVPEMAEVTPKFGETDHYLPANYSTVVWGYYDPNATAATAPVSMASGETITIEVITHHSGHDYAKMIRGDKAVEEIFAWESTETAINKTEPKMPGSGVHLITGPVNIEGGMPGDILQVDILELDPRPGPIDGRTFGTNSQKFAGYHFRLGEKRDGTEYTRSGGTEAITVFEFVQDEDDKMLYGKPVYMYRFPNMTNAVGDEVNIDNNPAVVVPQEFNYGYDLELLEEEPIVYPPGFDDIVVTDEGGIVYLNPDPAGLDWKVPLRPHLGTLAVLPSNSANYISGSQGGASTIPPSRFGGNIDDWRIGKGGTMYYKCEVEGCLLLAGDTHAAQGDSELAGTAMETSMTAKLRVTLHKADSLPKLVTGVDWPLLETNTEYVVHGFAYANYLDELENPPSIFQEGASIDAAMEDCYVKTRNWLMDAWDLIEEETIALMTTSIDFGVTQVVDGNWGAHAIIPKFVFDPSDAGFDYSCTTSKTAGRRHLQESPRRLQEAERKSLYDKHSRENISFDEYADRFYSKVTNSCDSCESSSMRGLLLDKLLDAKLSFLQKVTQA